jgi:hypothetical protein
VIRESLTVPRKCHDEACLPFDEERFTLKPFSEAFWEALYVRALISPMHPNDVFVTVEKSAIPCG